MKGIILAGGSGTRLYPLTLVTSKQLLPVFDKPMIYYPLSILMLTGIKDILIISTKEDLPRMESLLGDGSKYGINLSYKVQETPNGLASAFTLGEDFIKDDSVSMILGDNIFFGAGLKNHLISSLKRAEKDDVATIFAYHVKDPSRFGIIEFDKDYNAINIEEKPANPKSTYAVTGLYFYPKGVANLAKKIKPSKRNEYEITDLNNMYIKDNKLHVVSLGRGYSWIDAGTPESLYDAGSYIKMIEEHQEIKIACLEEIAYKNNWISKTELLMQAEKMKNTQYGKYLFDVANNSIKY